MMGLCSNSIQEDLLIDLLFRFNYISTDMFTDSLYKLVNNIFTDWELPIDKTQIIATAHDSDPDSSQLLVQMLKPVLADLGYDVVKVHNKITDSVKFIVDFPNAVFVDEFIGTGTTIAKRVKNYNHYYNEYFTKNSLVPNFNIKICATTCMNIAEQNIQMTGCDYYCVNWLERGISDYYDQESIFGMIFEMLEIESNLDHNSGTEEFCSLGWGKAEALYTLQGSNTPNSVFPIFWWKHLRKRPIRKTVLNRK